jgi:Peptidase family M23
MAWFNYPTTQDFGENGERGIDLGTPNNTPLSMPMSGTVLAAQYYGGGGEVIVKTANNVIEYFFHLNNIFVKPGDSIKAGQVVGTSGGGVGDKYLNPQGQVAIVTNQSQLAPYSSGYHTEYGLLSGSSMQDFYTAMNTGANSINPNNFIQNLIKTGLPTVLPSSNTTSTTATLSDNPLDIQSQISQWVANYFSTSLNPLLLNAGTISLFIVISLVLVIFGMSLLTGAISIPDSPSKEAILQNLHKAVRK